MVQYYVKIKFNESTAVKTTENDIDEQILIEDTGSYWIIENKLEHEEKTSKYVIETQ